MRQTASTVYVQVLRYGIALILVIAPFYLTISIWLYQFVKDLDFIKTWQELALILFALAASGFLILHHEIVRKFLKSRLVQLILVYVALLLIVGIYDLVTNRVSDRAVIYGWIIDLRPPVIFLLVALTAVAVRMERLASLPWRKVIIIPAILAIGFGFLQAVALPKAVLSHVGYGVHTTLPYETVDNQPGIVRVQSTLDGPNPLGAYIVMILVFLACWVWSDKNKKQRAAIVVFAVICLITLYKTYSRSAELGLILAIFMFLIIRLSGRRLRLYLGAAVSIIVVLGAIGFVLLAHNYRAQNVLLHSSSQSKSAVSSNQQHLSAEKRGAEDIIHQPLGGGVGSAGPASRRNTKASTRIAENYYLQIGQEAGVLGLVLFLAINIMLAYELWRRRQVELPGALLVAFIPLIFISLLWHGWADQTIAFIWWGLAGFALGPFISRTIEDKIPVSSVSGEPAIMRAKHNQKHGKKIPAAT